MRKSLSEQICKLCGIKPRIIQDYELNDIVIYPDFENNNNNFVRLGNIKLKYNNYITIFYIVNYLSDNTWSNKREFLINLVSILKDECSCSYYNNLRELIKSRIRNTIWEV